MLQEIHLIYRSNLVTENTFSRDDDEHFAENVSDKITPRNDVEES